MTYDDYNQACKQAEYLRHLASDLHKAGQRETGNDIQDAAIKIEELAYDLRVATKRLKK